MPGGRPPVDPKERFITKFTVSESGCHEWNGTRHRDGYGKFYFRGKQIQAHRASYILYHGEIPDGLMVLHKCDNRKCVNPEHLYAGTAKQNVADKVERNLWYGRMKYTATDICKCQELRELGLSQQAISDKLGINQTTVSRFLRGDFKPRKI